MSTTQHTGHYNLPTFGDNPNDRPSWRGDFTDAMTKIDNQMYTNATNTTTATAAANNANTAAQQAKESAGNAAKLAQANKTEIDEQASYFNALGVTSVPTAQNLMSTINGKAENTALTALRGTVSTLSGSIDSKADKSSVYTTTQADARYTQQGGYSGTARTLNDNISRLSGSLDSNTSKINENVKVIRESIGYNDNIVVIGDSWVDGYYGSAKHPTDSPANAIYDILSPQSKQTLGTSAGGFSAHGDNGTFLDRWNAVQNKSSVDRVILIGGQNDVVNKQSVDSSIQQSIVNTINTIASEAPHAIIDVFPMCLAVGESMSRALNQIGNDPRTVMYQMFTKITNFPRLVIHEGAYRAGVWAANASDGGDDGDGAHLSKLGYVEFGHAVGSCILHNTTFFPTVDGGVSESELPGNWKYINVFETGGMLNIEYNITLSGSTSNGKRIFRVPKKFSVGASKFWKDFSEKYFVSFDGNTLSLQGVSNLGNGDVVSGSQLILAGF